MKTLHIFLTVALINVFALVNVFAQTVAIGHVSAEVVESVSASSLAVTGFDLKNENIRNVALQAGQVNLNYENVNLGKFKINSGRDVACNIVMKSAALSDVNGNQFTIEPSATGLGQSDAQRTDGNQTLQLQGKVLASQGQASGLYQGSYTMVFAYN